MPEVIGSLIAPRQSAAPASPVAGQLYFDTDVNKLYWWNGFSWIAAEGGAGSAVADNHFCRLESSAQTTCTSATWANITLGDAVYDPDGMKSGNTIVIPEDGWYIITGRVAFATDTAGQRYVGFSVNGGTLPVSTAGGWSSAGTANVRIVHADMRYLHAGDVVGLMGYQNSGGNLPTVIAGEDYKPYLSVSSVNGAKGDIGATGMAGADGLGVPAGGAAGQILTKVSSTDNDTAWQTTAVAAGVPTGAVMMWPTATPPTGWLLCDGSAIDSGYTALITLVGATTPDMRSRVPVGYDSTVTEFNTMQKSNAPTVSIANLIKHQLTIAEMPAHNHTLNNQGNAVTTGGGDRPIVPGTAIATSNRGGDTPHNNLQPYRVLHFIIKT